MDLYEAIETMEKAIGLYEKYADSPYQMPSPDCASMSRRCGSRQPACHYI